MPFSCWEMLLMGIALMGATLVGRTGSHGEYLFFV